ncbi:MAG: hypothetical protein JW966_05955 [Anaerolineae bacterium]|nr:hypothetical protein [Anaerolineae bacterium]
MRIKTSVLPFLVVVALLAALLAGGLTVAGAADPAPTIIMFTSSLENVTVADAEAGTLTTTLTWHTVGVTDAHTLTLHSYQRNTWVALFDENSVPLESKGARVVTVQHPMNFGPPTYLLSIVDAQSRVVDQRTLSIPYVESDALPVLETLTADVESISGEMLNAGNARVNLTWKVSDRLPTSNLVFEQIITGESGAESAVSVELPRDTLWVASSATGPVVPVAVEGAQTVDLRAQIIDLVSGQIYDQQILSLNIGGAEVVQPDTAESTAVPPTKTPETVPDEIDLFTAEPNTVNPGAAVTLTWALRGTGSVTIEQIVPGIDTVETVVTAQSPQGSATVYVPDYAAYSVEYKLWTANRTDSASVNVAINCPYTYFFGKAADCPAGDDLTVQGAYQEFEGGFMIWRGDTFEIFVFYEDGTAAFFLEGTYAAMAESSPAETPPLDREVPVNSFGRVWANAPGVRDKLGWAVTPEQSYLMQFQQVALTRVPPPATSIYLTLPDDTVIGSGGGLWAEVE